MKIVIALLLMFPFFVQATDSVVLDGVESPIDEAPLDSYISQDTLSEILKPLAKCSAEDRCYSAKWSLSNELYLLQIRKDGGMNVPLSTIFPESRGKVKAIWFTGELRIFTGATMDSFFSESDKIVELVTVVEIADGVVMHRWMEQVQE